MKKEIFINESMGETRIAIQEDGQIVEVYIERQDKQRMVGNIYKGKVENVLPGMQAAFVDIGYDLNAFLPFSEIVSTLTSGAISKTILCENPRAKSSLLPWFDAL